MVSIGAFVSQLVDSLVEIGPKFLEVATRDPIAGVLVAFGALFVFVSVAVFGGLTLGAVVDLLTPSRTGREPRREAR
jgi:hypothetical protein